MKKLFLSSTYLLLGSQLFSQSDISGPGVGHLRVPGYYVGWTPGIGSTPGDLQIRNNFNDRINFHTNNSQRMLIDNGGIGGAAGQVALGNNLPIGFTPTARLHMHQDAGNIFTRYTSNLTGTGINSGLIMGISNAGQGIIANYTADQPITFFTENLPPVVTFERMRINANDRNGFIGMGNAGNFPANAQLHINTIGIPAGVLGAAAYGNLFRSDGNDAIRCQWQFFTGPNQAGLTEKLVMYSAPNAVTQVNSQAEDQAHIQASQGDLVLRAKGFGLCTSNPVAQEVLRVTRTCVPGVIQTADEGRVSISRLNGASGTIVEPYAMLHIGDQYNQLLPYNNPVGIAGWRPWMDVGVYSNIRSDNVYIGLKQIAADQTNAVLTWGNNPSSNPGNGDRFLFIFTAAQQAGNGAAQGPDGLEIGRFWTNGTLNRVGFGGDPTINLYSTGSIDPQNTLEVNSQGAVGNPGGSSGLRFTDLTAASPPTNNVANGNVLSVDANGDVILVPDFGLNFGGTCNFVNPPPSMNQDFQIPMNDKNFIWSGQGTTGNNVGIGLSNCTPFAKLHVVQNSGLVPPVASPGSIGILSINSDMDGVALMAISNGTAVGTLTKVAGWFQTTPAAGAEQVAIFVPAGGGFVEIGYAYPHVTTHRLDVSGTVAANGVALTSDQSLKQNVNTIAYGMDIIERLNPVTFEWILPLDSGMTGTHSGFIAQQVDTVIPHAVKMGGDSTFNLAYTEIIPYLVKALQEEHSRNDSLAERLDSLTQAVGSCCSSNVRMSNNTNQQDVTLTDTKSIVLNQNVPNPFAEQTTISFLLPESVVKAQMLFYDAQGKLIKAVDLEGRGAGQLNVFADDLSNGVYSYALVADGEVIDTKQMVKTK